MIPSRRIWGVETEYGVTCASTTGGQPPMDAEEAATLLFKPVVAMGRSSNMFTRNGGRLYLDVGSHPEWATAETDSLEDLLNQDRSGVLMLRDLVERANESLTRDGIDGRIHLFRNNLDSEGSSFGCHENYLVRRRRDYEELVGTLIPFFVTRQLITGAGHVTVNEGRIRYEFSQRAAHTWGAVSSASTRSRPIVNTRDEPHADVDTYRRMHVIVGDSNMSESATLLKVALTDLLLAMVEDGTWFSLELTDPMLAIRETSSDLTGQAPLELTNGRRMSAVAVQKYYYDAVVAAFGHEPTPWHGIAIDLWGRAIEAIERNDYSMIDTELDWAIKQKFITRYLQRPGATGTGVERLALAYHDITDAGLQLRFENSGLMKRLTNDDAVRSAISTPPQTTRAKIRGDFIAVASDHRRDFVVDWTKVRLADEPTVMLYDPFATQDPRVDELISIIQAGTNDGSHSRYPMLRR